MQIVHRTDAAMPFQTWSPFPPDAIVKVWSYFSDVPPVIALAKDLWWGYETEMDDVSEGVIAKAARLDRPKGSKNV